MACKYCHKIRSLLLHGKMAEAAGVTVEKLRESIGWKDVEKNLEKIDFSKSGVFKMADRVDGVISNGERELLIPTNGESSILHPETSARAETTKRKPKL